MVTRQSTREKLLDAAEQLLFADGVVATPVDAILERAGVSAATLYRAYASKEDLVAAALERRHEQWLACWDAEVERAGDPRARLLAVLDALETFRGRPGGARWCAFLGTAAEYADPPAGLAGAVRRESTSLHDRLRALAEPVAGAQAETLARALVLIVSGHLAMRLRSEVDADSARWLADAAVDHALATRQR